MKTVKFQVAVLLIAVIMSFSLTLAESSPSPEASADKEPLITAVVEEGPFAINSFYLSGEGPGRIREISVGDLIDAKKTVWAESTPGASVVAAHVAQTAPSQRLYWARGAKLEIIDENGHVLPQPEFLCHSLIAFSGHEHWGYFPHSSGISEGFLFNFSQGITDIMLPDDDALPLNNNERLRFEFKSLNRTSDQHRLIKCRWTLYFLDDKELTHPIKALNLFHSGISVLVGGLKSKNRLLPAGCGGMCGLEGMSAAKDAPNDVLHRKLNVPFDKNENGEDLTWHWVIPPGRHKYRTMHPEHHFDDEGPIRAAGAHVHPFCEKISMIEVRHGLPDKVVFTIHSRTDTSHGIRIAHIDYLTWPTAGIVLDKGAEYGWEVTYNNTSGVDQDSMAGVTLYFSDNRFQKPAWAL